MLILIKYDKSVNIKFSFLSVEGRAIRDRIQNPSLQLLKPYLFLMILSV